MPLYAMLPTLTEYCVEQGWTLAYSRWGELSAWLAGGGLHCTGGGALRSCACLPGGLGGLCYSDAGCRPLPGCLGVAGGSSKVPIALPPTVLLLLLLRVPLPPAAGWATSGWRATSSTLRCT